jgi:hypothetical protein
MSLLSLGGGLPAVGWQPLATLGLAGVMFSLSATDGPDRRLFHPRHVRQLAELLDGTRSGSSLAGELRIGETSLGLRVSASKTREAGREVEIFAFSCRDPELSPRSARRLAGLIRRLLRAGGAAEMLAGPHGVYHLVLPSDRSAHAL